MEDFIFDMIKQRVKKKKPGKAKSITHTHTQLEASVIITLCCFYFIQKLLEIRFTGMSLL